MAGPTTSVISAVMQKYEELPSALFPDGERPGIYLDSAPLVADGTQLLPPYVVCRDGGSAPSFEMEHSSIDTNLFSLEVYYPSLADIDTAVAAIKWAGGRPSDGLGLDFGDLPALQLPRTKLSVVRTREQRRFAGYTRTGVRCHVCEISYRVTIQEAA